MQVEDQVGQQMQQAGQQMQEQVIHVEDQVEVPPAIPKAVVKGKGGKKGKGKKGIILVC